MAIIYIKEMQDEIRLLNFALADRDNYIKAFSNDVDSLRASNARLRDALENLCDTIEPVVGHLVTVEARAALEGKR